MDNYFNYFTEIEEHFQKRRGTLMILSPLDWALMETWKQAGVPLEAVLRGIDRSFDKWELRRSRTRRVNSLAYCAQEVLASAEEMKEAAIGSSAVKKAAPRLEREAVSAFLRQNAERAAEERNAGDRSREPHRNDRVRDEERGHAGLRRRQEEK